jgi:hypothetical protein
MNLELGYAFAMKIVETPRPHPTSATSAFSVFSFSCTLTLSRDGIHELATFVL